MLSHGLKVCVMLPGSATSRCNSTWSSGTADTVMDSTVSATTSQDLPDELWLKCTLDTDLGTETEVGVCRRLLKVALLWRRMSLNLRLGQPEECSASRKSLLSLAQAFKVRGLRIGLMKGPEPMIEQLAELLAPPAAAVPTGTPWLVNITRLTVHSNDQASLCLPQLVPDVIAAACPNLTELRLSNLQLGTPTDTFMPFLQYVFSFLNNGLVQPATQQRRQLAGLQKLHLTGCHLYLPPQAFQQQMQELRGLHKFDFWSCKLHGGDGAAYYAGIVGSVSQQLTQLNLNVPSEPRPVTTALLSCPYPALKTLDLSTAVVDDAAMKLLIEHTPRLEVLYIDSFQLKTDYSRSSCRWRHIMMHNCDVFSMPLLPVHSGLKIMVCTRKPELRLVNTGRGLAADLQVTAAAVAAAQRCALFRAYGGNLVIDIGPSAPLHMQQVLLATTPLLRGGYALEFQGAVIGRTLLTALQQYQQISRVCFAKSCIFEQGIHVWEFR